MNKKELVERFKKEFPEFNKWRNWGDNFNTQFACARFAIEDDYDTGAPGLGISGRVIEKMLEFCTPYLSEHGISREKFKEILNINEEYIFLDSLDSNTTDLIIKCLRCWVNYINGLRSPKWSTPEDQIVIIHPDWDIEYGFEDDFKAIVDVDQDEDCSDYRIGIMSTEKWNFGNDKLNDELNENSGDCFCIWEYEDDCIQDRFPKTYEELKKVYPDIDSITKIYDTDFD